MLSIGRVQTLIFLGLVVHRDQAIEKFVSKMFYEFSITLQTARGEQFIAKWNPSKACEPYADEEVRILSNKLVSAVVNKVMHHQGVVTVVKKTKKK